jgi:hypothetical protein
VAITALGLRADLRARLVGAAHAGVRALAGLLVGVVQLAV